MSDTTNKNNSHHPTADAASASASASAAAAAAAAAMNHRLDQALLLQNPYLLSMQLQNRALLQQSLLLQPTGLLQALPVVTMPLPSLVSPLSQLNFLRDPASQVAHGGILSHSQLAASLLSSSSASSILAPHVSSSSAASSRSSEMGHDAAMKRQRQEVTKLAAAMIKNDRSKSGESSQSAHRNQKQSYPAPNDDDDDDDDESEVEGEESVNDSYASGGNSKQGPSKKQRNQQPSYRFGNRQADTWKQKFQELQEFKRKHGNCSVPYKWKNNPELSQWVKRQRYQKKLKMQGKHSTLTDDREKALEKIGFVWDSHEASWEEHYRQLEAFRLEHGHCFVPTTDPKTKPLSIWIKSQRRLARLYVNKQSSNITQERIDRLSKLGFDWNPSIGAKSHPSKNV